MAIIGVSRNPRHFSAYLLKELLRRGYEVLPVNPTAPSIGGRACFASVRDIQPPVTAALVITPAPQTDAVVHECADAGIRQVWLYRATGEGSVTASAVSFCRARGIDVIAGECPLMFVSRPGFHAVHGLVRKIIGTYPRPEVA